MRNVPKRTPTRSEKKRNDVKRALKRVPQDGEKRGGEKRCVEKRGNIKSELSRRRRRRRRHNAAHH